MLGYLHAINQQNEIAIIVSFLVKKVNEISLKHRNRCKEQERKKEIFFLKKLSNKPKLLKNKV